MLKGEVVTNIEGRCCSYCLLPARVPGQKLKRCSRCHRAWYHDAECQRKHFPAHKKDCMKWSKEISSNQLVSGDKKSVTSSFNNVCRFEKDKFHVEKKESRGKCLVVSPGQSIRKGEKIRDHGRGRDFWEPLILPVLHEDYRSNCCALCFSVLPQQPLSFDQAPENTFYRLLFCSMNCRRIASASDMEREERDCYNFLQRIKDHSHKPRRIFSTAIMLYRILIREQRLSRNEAHIKEQLHTLQSKPHREMSNTSNDTDDDDYDTHHTRGVIAIAMGMLQCSDLSLSSEYRPSMEYLVDMVYRIKVNCFSIFYEKGFETCGLGLFGTPSFMNHSCRANALQTFFFRKGSPPCLHVTAFRDIASNQEICISYTDTSCPSHIRRKRLQKDYYFMCNCEACDPNSELQDDSKTMAMRCFDCSSEPSSPTKSFSSVFRADRGMTPSRPVYSCSQCNNTDFQSTLQQLRAFEIKISGIESTVATSFKEVRDTYQNLKKICHMGSWYVQEAGDRLLHEYLDRLPRLVGDFEREQKTAWAALKLAEELLGKSSTTSTGSVRREIFHSTSSFLRHQQLRHKVAKLRLFLVPDPRQSICELQDILSSLRPYFSDEHAAIIELKATLASTSM